MLTFVRSLNYYTLKILPLMNAPQMNHTEYMKKVKKLSEESLRYIIKDCREAMSAMPNNPKNGYYADEIHYCNMELVSRKNKGK
jgi:hypothetical protein